MLNCEIFSCNINLGLKGGSLEPWSPKMFVLEPGAESLSVLGTRTKIVILAKWSPRI